MDLTPKKPSTKRITSQARSLFGPKPTASGRFVPPPAPAPVPDGARAFDGCCFATVDFETTGVGCDDRIVEIGVVRFIGDGSASDQWSTLVNPGRDLGTARAIHGVTTFQDVRHAPRFADIAGDLVERLKGCVLVAHNLAFEQRFLHYEFGHLGLRLPVLPAVCTLQLGCLLGATSRRLDHLCRQFGLPLKNTHSALADAWATARLLVVYLAILKTAGRGWLEAIGCATPHPPVSAWPQLPRTGMVFDRYTTEALPEREAPVETAAFMRRIVSRLPATSVEEHAQYLDLLDRVVADLQLTAGELAALSSFATESGLGDDARRGLHDSYFDAVVATAWEDGVLTDEERGQILLVGTALGTDQARLTAALVPR